MSEQISIDGGERTNCFENPGQYDQGPRRNLFIWLAMNLVTLTHAFEATCLSVSVPQISTEFDASLADTMGFSSSFLLAMSLIQPFTSEISHITGRRPAILFALFAFLLGAIVCGWAQSSIMLMVGRAVQGIGAGATEPIKAYILYDIYPTRERLKWSAYGNASWAIGTIMGPLLGGLFTENLSWRWVFWINIPFLVISFVAFALLLGYDTSKKSKWKEMLTVDWTGLIIFAISGAGVLISLGWSGSRYQWHELPVFLPFIIGVLGFVLLGIYENRVAKRPAFRPEIFPDYSAIIHCVNIGLHGLIMWLLLTYTAMYYVGIKGTTPFQTGLRILPATVIVVPMSILVGVVVGRTGEYRSFLWAGWLLTVIPLGLLHLIKKDTGLEFLIPITIALGIGFGVLLPAMGVAFQGTVDGSLAGHVICVSFLVRPAGQSLGISIGYAVGALQLRKMLLRKGHPASWAEKIFEYARKTGQKEKLDPDIQRIVPELEDAGIEALRAIWTTATCFAGLALLLTLIAKCPAFPKGGNESEEHDEEQSQQRQRQQDTDHGENRIEGAASDEEKKDDRIYNDTPSTQQEEFNKIHVVPKDTSLASGR